MDDFYVIANNSNVADDTINDIQCSISDDSYEISTIVCIKPSETKDIHLDFNQIFVNPLLQNGNVILSYQKTLTIFADNTLNKVLLNENFESPICDICLSNDKLYILVCLCDGSVKVFDRESSIVIFSDSLDVLDDNVPTEQCFIKGFPDKTTEANVCFIIISGNGKIFRLTLDLSAYNNKQTLESASLGHVEEFYHIQKTVKQAAYSYPYLVTLSNTITIFNTQNSYCLNDCSNYFKLIVPFGYVFLGLTHEGNLFEIWPLTLVQLPIDYNQDLENIVAINERQKCQLLVRTKIDEQGYSFIQMLNSDFSKLFSLNVSRPIIFFQLEKLTDDVLFLSNYVKEGKFELRLQTVKETNPESHLNKLIKRQLFEEADKFVSKFNLNPILVLKAKAQIIVDKPICDMNDIKNLISLLNLIEDELFILNSCLSVDCETIECKRKILEYGANIRINTNQNEKELKKVLVGLIFRLNIFTMLSNNRESWDNFVNIDLVEEVKNLLRTGQIEDAIVIYSRLDKNTINHSLNLENVQEILFIIKELPRSDCEQFLGCFIPLTLAYLPSTLPLFVKWLYQQILQIQNEDKIHFPENALKFADFILKLLKVDKAHAINFQRYCVLGTETLKELTNLVDALKSIKMLKVKFGVHFALETYLKGPKAVSNIILNLEKSPETYDKLIKEFLHPYMLQNKMNVDSVLFETTMILVKYEAYSIEYIKILLKYITSLETKLKVVENLLEYSKIPWDKRIKEIAHKALNYSHPNVYIIKEKLNAEPILTVLQNPKYCCIEDTMQFSCIKEFKMIVEHIVYVHEPYFIEDVYKICRNSEERQEANFILIKNLIFKNEIDKAMNLFKACKDEEVYNCADRLFWHLNTSMNNIFLSEKCKENLFLSVRSIYTKLMVCCGDDEFKKENYAKCYSAMEAAYMINKTFKKHVSSNELISRNRQIEIFPQLLDEIKNRFVEGQWDMKQIFQACEVLAKSFDMDKDFVLIKLCNNVEIFDFILTIAEHLHKSESNSRNLCLILVLLFKCLGSESFGMNDNELNETAICFQKAPLFSEETDTKNQNNYLKAIQFLKEGIAKALISSEDEDILPIMEVANWINNYIYSSANYRTLKNRLFKNLYCTESVPSKKTFLPVNEMFNGLLKLIANANNSNFRYLIAFEDPNDHYPKIFENSIQIKNICQDGQHLTALHVMLNLQRTLSLVKNSDMLKSVEKNLKSTCIPILSQSILAKKHIDIDLLYNLYLVMGKDCQKFLQYALQFYKRQPKKLHDLCVVGLKLLKVYPSIVPEKQLYNNILCYKWWMKLIDFNKIMEYDSFFKTNQNDRLISLIHLNCITVQTLNEYCKDFELQKASYYNEFLKNSLLNWKPDYEQQVNNFGVTTLIVKNNQQDLYEEIVKIICCVENKKEILLMLEEILPKVNFYYYEVFDCIYQILCKFGENKQRYGTEVIVLQFLKKYQRDAQPGQKEKEEWFTNFDIQMLDPLSEFRLPFTQYLFTSNIWDIIQSEINLKTYKNWFYLAGIPKLLNKNDICVYALKQVVSSGILGNSLSKDWILYPKLDCLLEDVDECAKNISDLEKATSAVYHLMQHIPNGIDKVNAAELTLKYAFLCSEKFPDSPKMKKAYLRVKNKYYTYSVMNILYKFNLAENEYLQLAMQPETLINNLYMDERILKQANSVTVSCPDINQAVEAIADLFKLDIEIIRSKLLNNYLNQQEMVELDSTMILPNILTGTTTTNEDEANLVRAIYICNSNQQKWELWLLKLGLNEQLNISFAVRSLRCYCAIVNEENIVKQTKISYKEFLYHVKQMSILSDLETLGIQLTLKMFKTHNKKDLLKKLSKIDNPLAIKVMASICMTYEIYESLIWEFIINNSIHYGQEKELKTYVDFLVGESDSAYFLKAWQAILDFSFKRLERCAPEEVDDAYVQNFLTIQSCPMPFSLNFKEIFDICIKNEKYEFAAMLLQYMSENLRREYLNEIPNNKSLFSALEALRQKGIIGVNEVKNLLELYLH